MVKILVQSQKHPFVLVAAGVLISEILLLIISLLDNKAQMGALYGSTFKISFYFMLLAKLQIYQLPVERKPALSVKESILQMCTDNL